MAPGGIPHWVNCDGVVTFQSPPSALTSRMLASMRRRRISTSFRWFARQVGLSSDGKGQDGILGGIAADRGRQRWRVDDSARNRTSANIRSGLVLDRLSTVRNFTLVTMPASSAIRAGN